jgi:UDP-3-O-[3-hydroxymyristoyl] glucosamine N-acyltransferase
MTEPLFFQRGPGLTVAEIASLTGAELRRAGQPDRRVSNIAALDRAGPGDLTFLDSPKYAEQLQTCAAAACLLSERFAGDAPEKLTLLVIGDPYSAFVKVGRRLFPDALRPSSLFEAGSAPGAHIHPTARLESGVALDPGVVIGPQAEIGAGTVIGANAVIGAGVRIGRDSAVGSNCSITHALIGDRVIIHPGCRIGQDGFGFTMSAGRYQKVPQLGRVIIQDDVEIGAGTAIDRGGIRDTVIGEGTKIDNLVQIAHNITIGRHCIIVSQVGLSGSVVVGDYAMLGGQVGVVDHVTIGEGAQIAARAAVLSDGVPAGERWAGYPAVPLREWARGNVAMRRLARRGAGKARATSAPEGTEE